MPAGFKLLDAYVEVTADASKVVGDAERQIRSGSGRMTSAGSGLGSALMGGMQGVVGGLVGGVVSAFAVPLVQGVGQAVDAVLATAKTAIFDYNTTLENANIGFTTMLGSAQKARDFLGELQTFAAKTPFEFSDLTLASQRLIAMGINAKNVIPTMTAIGDAVAGLGGDKGTIDQLTTAIGQMAAKGKIQGDELMQLTEAGVPALKILADGYGVTTSKMSDMISAGKVLSDRAIPMIVRGLEKGTKTTAGFGGMMEKQSKTMSGAMSNISDSINQTLSKAFLPMFKVVERAAGALAKFAGSKAVTNWAKDTAANVSRFLGQIEKAIKGVFADPKVQKSMGDFGAEFSKSLKGAGPALKDILPNLTKFAKDSLPGFVDGLGKGVKAIGPFLKDLRGLSKDLASNGKDWGTFASGVGGAIHDIVQFLADLDKSVDNFKQWQRDVKKGFYDFLGDLGALPGKFGQMGADIIGGLIGGLTAKFTEAMVTVRDMASQVASAFAKVLGIQSPSKVFHQYGKWIVEGLQKGLLGSVDQIKDASGKLADAIKSKFSGGTENAMLSELSRVTKKLVSEAKERQKVVDQIAVQRDRLAGLKSDRADYRSGVRSSVLDSGNIANTFQTGLDNYATWKDTNATYQKGLADARTQDARARMNAVAGTLDGRGYQASYTTAGGWSAVAEFMANNAAPGKKPLTGLALIKSNLKKLLADTKKFTANMKTLVGRGIYRDLFQQLIQAGPTAGLEITNDLVSNRGGFNDINSLAKQVATAGNDLGEFGAEFTYNGQIRSTQKRINSLDRQADQINVTMIVEARKIDEVDKVVRTIRAAAKTAKSAKAKRKR